MVFRRACRPSMNTFISFTLMAWLVTKRPSPLPDSPNDVRLRIKMNEIKETPRLQQRTNIQIEAGHPCLCRLRTPSSDPTLEHGHSQVRAHSPASPFAFSSA